MRHEDRARPFRISLWTRGENGFHTYRIPSLVVTTPGSLLAFCEGRRTSGGDSGDVALLARRSTDGGCSWGEQRVVWDDPGNTCGNPCAVVDRQAGVVWLLMTRNLGSDDEKAIIDSASRDTRRAFVTRSDDDGVSWSAPAEITGDVKLPNWTWYATGPGAGIQLRHGAHAGRLVIPCDHIEADTRRCYSHVVISDDHGAHWRRGGRTPQDQVNECEVVELPGGELLLNMRNYDPTRRARKVSTSMDAGETWGPLKSDPVLVEPICQASIRRASRQEHDTLVFSNPAHGERRENMTVRTSLDGGRTWPCRRTLHAGPSAYSCLAALPDGDMAILYEAGRESPYEGIVFSRFGLDWVAGP
ncbi:MAG: sialidase family protein [Spirochaetes bacterium]|nr:sialidase family protein [Spirochaetota bacterium]